MPHAELTVAVIAAIHAFVIVLLKEAETKPQSNSKAYGNSSVGNVNDVQSEGHILLALFTLGDASVQQLTV